MSSIYSYFTSYFYNDDKIEQKEDKPKFLITSDDLKKLNLKSTENIIPAPSRNMPLLDTFELCIHNKEPFINSLFKNRIHFKTNSACMWINIFIIIFITINFTFFIFIYKFNFNVIIVG